MDERGVSNAQLAASSGASPNAVANWLMRGSVPYRPTMDRVCVFLGVNRDWLIEGTGQKQAIKRRAVPIPQDIQADLNALGEAAVRSKDVRGVVGHLARAFRQ